MGLRRFCLALFCTRLVSVTVLRSLKSQIAFSRFPGCCHRPPAMALFAAPLALAIGGGSYLWAAFKLSLAVDAATRSRLQPPGLPAGPPQVHLTLGAAVWACSYALSARALRPAFGRLRKPEGVESFMQLVQTLAPGLMRHCTACTLGVASAAAASAAYDVRQQQQRGRATATR